MQKVLLLGADWPAELVDRLAARLDGWTARRWSDASEPDRAKARVLVPFHLKVDRSLMANSGLRLVHQFGVGVDNVDLAAARELGVAVANAPSNQSGMSASVAEGAVLLVLSCARLPSLRAHNLATGTWNWTTPLNLGLAGRRAGLVGLGSIGKAIAARLKVFDMRVSAVRRSGDNGDAARLGLDWIGKMDRLGELVEQSDVIVISVPLNEGTRQLFSAGLIARMKLTASLINVGRGPIIDEAALLAALEGGRLHAAGLDVLTQEPPAPDSPFLTHPRVVLTPHDAGVSDTAFDGVAQMIAENLQRLTDGSPLLNRVT